MPRQDLVAGASLCRILPKLSAGPARRRGALFGISGETVRVVCAIAHVPNEGQWRELAPLAKKATPEVVRKVYAEAVEEAGVPKS